MRKSNLHITVRWNDLLQILTAALTGLHELHFFLRFYFQREGKGERKRERSMLVRNISRPPTGDLAYDTGLCPDRVGIESRNFWLTDQHSVH